jgi:hypothetical protein
VNAIAAPDHKNAGLAASRFFLRVGQVGRASEITDTYTRPLFSLALILEADGTLAADARRVLEAAA